MSDRDDWADVARLAGRRVLVVGDLVLDEYITGRPSRVSREAPVLVLDVFDSQDRAGSAGSPAANVLALGSQAAVVGVVGCDQQGDRIVADLNDRQVDTSGVVRWPDTVTSTKTRILAEGFTGGLHGRQQVLRLDRATILAPSASQACVTQITRVAAEFDAVLLSDYRGGVVSDQAIEAARATGRPIVVDSQGDLRRFCGVDLLKVNQAEAQAALGHRDVHGGGEGLRRQLEARALVITLGADGMLVFDAGTPAVHVAAVQATQVFDVTGAGDTVVAILALGLIGGLHLRRAAELASAAASVVVRRLGVAVATPDEIVEALSRNGLAS